MDSFFDKYVLPHLDRYLAPLQQKVEQRDLEIAQLQKRVAEFSMMEVLSEVSGLLLNLNCLQ